MSEFEQHPWLAELRANPAQAVADLLAGRSDKYPYARLRDAEFLLRVLPRREGREDEYDKLETALLEWLNERRREPWTIRTKHGLPVYVAALIEALDAVQLLGLRRVAGQLGELHNAYLRWLEPLRMGQATDPALELWRCHALLPNDRRFLPHWMHFCDEAGSTRPATYLGVALQGLRELPGEDAAASLRYALLGVAHHYLARQEQSDAKAELRSHCAALRFVYPYGPDGWRKEWDKVMSELKREQADMVRAALDDQPKNKGYKPQSRKQREPHLDPSRFPSVSELASQLKAAQVVEPLWNRIENAISIPLGYCRVTGDSYNFIRTLCYLGDLFLKRTRDQVKYASLLLRWLPEALQWGRDNPLVWMLWAQCLEAVGAEEHAEWVYWEMRRYFPDNDHCRTELARLLKRQERNDEAMALLREAVERNPNHKHSRVELARLLMAQGKEYFPEAKKWLLEVINQNPTDEHSHVELARLLRAQGKEHYPEAEKWLRKVTDQKPSHEHSRVELARLLMAQGKKHYPEAEKWLRKVIDQNPDHEHSRVELARLLMVQGKEHYPEAEKWLHDATKRHPDSTHCHNELARLLSLSGKNADAITLLEASNLKYPGNEIVETSLQHLRKGLTISLPSFDDEDQALETSLPTRKTSSPPITSTANIAAVPDRFSQAAARAARAAFRMALPNGLAQQGRDDLERALREDPDDLLAAFYLDWAQCLLEDYQAPPDAYALAVARAYRSPADAVWKNLSQRFFGQRRITWGLRWMSTLRDGSTLPEDVEKQLKKLQQRLSDESASEKQTAYSAGEAIVARLVDASSKSNTKPEPAWLDRQAQELIALTINRNLDPVALSIH